MDSISRAPIPAIFCLAAAGSRCKRPKPIKIVPVVLCFITHALEYELLVDQGEYVHHMVLWKTVVAYSLPQAEGVADLGGGHFR